MKIFSNGNSINMSGNNISMSNNKVTINNKTINVPKGASVSVINGQVYVNGKLQEDLSESQINLIINGDVGELSTDCAVECKNVTGNVKAGSYVECGNVGGSVVSGSYVEADVIKGNVKAGSYIEYNGK